MAKRPILVQPTNSPPFSVTEPKKRSQLPLLVIALLGFVAAGFIGDCISPPVRRNDGPSAPPERQAKESQPSRLKDESCITDDCLVCIDIKTFGEVTDAAVARDAFGYHGAVASGKAWPVGAGTRVKVLQSGFTRTRIRVLEGPATGIAGYVATEFVR